MSNLLRTAVSRKKRRYQKDGYDLDLAYITERVIAMGFPSEGAEGIYRNPYDEVLRFLDEKHGQYYKVYNLCSEREYPSTHFYGRTARYPFDDHNAPPFELLEEICKDMKAFLDQDERNVVVIHCKAGKGRTGCVICCWLLYTRLWNNAADALEFYGAKRTYNKKGVTIPSQRRYVAYFCEYLNFGIRETQPLLIDKCILHNPPKFFANLDYLHLVIRGPYPEKKELLSVKYAPKDYFKQMKAKRAANPSKYEPSVTSAAGEDENSEEWMEKLSQEDGLAIDCNKLSVLGDLKLELYEKERGLGTSEKLIFSAWINTNFVDMNKRLIIPKAHLDKGLKDKRLDSHFALELILELDKSAMGGTRTRRRSVLSQLLVNKTVSNALLEEEQMERENAATSLIHRLRKTKATFNHTSDNTLPPHPRNLLLDKFPSLGHY